MRPARIWAGAIAALGAVAVAVPAVAPATEVTNWNRIATDTLVAIPGPAGGAPPALQIYMAMTQGAVYDAVNAIERRHRPYLLRTRFHPKASKDAAVATAAYRVLTDIVTTVPATIAFPNRAILLETLATAYAASLAPIPDNRSEIARDRRGERRRRRDDRRTAGRRTLRAVTVGAELRPRALAAAAEC